MGRTFIGTGLLQHCCQAGAINLYIGSPEAPLRAPLQDILYVASVFVCSDTHCVEHAATYTLLCSRMFNTVTA